MLNRPRLLGVVMPCTSSMPRMSMLVVSLPLPVAGVRGPRGLLEGAVEPFISFQKSSIEEEEVEGRFAAWATGDLKREVRCVEAEGTPLGLTFKALSRKAVRGLEGGRVLLVPEVVVGGVVEEGSLGVMEALVLLLLSFSAERAGVDERQRRELVVMMEDRDSAGPRNVVLSMAGCRRRSDSPARQQRSIVWWCWVRCRSMQLLGGGWCLRLLWSTSTFRAEVPRPTGSRAGLHLARSHVEASSSLFLLCISA